MSHPELGRIIEGRQYKDAIHIAIVPVMADTLLQPGQHVGLIAGSKVKVASAARHSHSSLIGIVDPFLRGPVRPGQWFWLLLYPQTITNLRHEWTHPAFESDQNAAKFLQGIAERIGCSYAALLDRLDLYADNSCGDDDAIQEGLNALQDESQLSQMWNAYESVRNKAVDSSIKTNTYFRCAC